jgi:hypothetical protein
MKEEEEREGTEGLNIECNVKREKSNEKFIESICREVTNYKQLFLHKV